MFGQPNNPSNNLKDNSSPLGIVVKDTSNPISYTKTNKLITALYMVTDIMDTEEPLRNKLRTSGVGIISDVNFMPRNALPKIAEIMSFLDIAGAVNLISEMNANILRKEFSELQKAILDSIDIPKPSYSELDLNELFKDDFSLSRRQTGLPSLNTKKEISSTNVSNSIGVQKGSTLLKALKDMTNKNPLMSDRKRSQQNADFEVLKKQRRQEIISIIKGDSNGATITDIKIKATGSLASCGEKTLQRELIGMLKDGVLNKTGEKRWSRYFLSS